MKNLTNEEIKAIEKVADIIGIDKENIEDYYNDDTITINKCRNGRIVAWCIWSEDNQACVYVDTLEELDEEEIEKELC